MQIGSAGARTHKGANSRGSAGVSAPPAHAPCARQTRQAGAGQQGAASGASANALCFASEAAASEARPLLVETQIDKVGVTILEVYEGKVHDLL